VRIHTYERIFLWLGAATLVACLLALTYGSLALHLHLPTAEGTVDPQQVGTTPPFDNPGVRQLGPGRYEVVMVGRVWTFAPPEIELPAGADVTFTMTSPDVIHGFYIERTRVNVMLIPGQIARVRHRFDQPGEYQFFCHEYCGVGHHTMHGRIVVK